MNNSVIGIDTKFTEEINLINGSKIFLNHVQY